MTVRLGLDGGDARTWHDVVPAARGEGWPDVTVDVFDTVVLRRVLLDRHVFSIVGARLVRAGRWPGTAGSFADARARARPGTEAPTLAEIYAEPDLAPLEDPDVARRVEEEVERALAAVAPGAATALDEVRRAGATVTFLSDMHLPDPLVRDVLDELDVLRPEDRVIVSSAVGGSKAGGGIFGALRSLPDVVHVGDSVWSDHAMTTAHGIPSLPLRSGAPTRAELTVAEAGVVGGAVAAAARRARVEAAAAESRTRALTETGADVVGQLLAGLLLWAREQCELLDRRHLVFVARDGELPLRFARRMPADHWTGHRLSYLHASRRTWALAAADVVGVERWITAGTATDRAFLDDKRHRVPLRSLLGRLGVSVDEVAVHLAGLDPDRPLPVGAADRWSALLADPAVHDLVAARAAAAADLVVRHLDERGLLDEPLALLDVGWSGQLAWQVSSILRAAAGHDPVHLHLGGANVATWVADEVDVRRFVFDDTVAPLPYPQAVASVEAYTASGAAPATGFEVAPDGRVVVVRGDRSPAVDTRARRVVWRAALAVADVLPTRAELRSWGASAATTAWSASDGAWPPAGVEPPLADAIRRMLADVWTEPRRAHAVTAGSLGYEIDDRGRLVGRVAVPYTLGEFLPGRPRPSRQWRQGSLAITPQPVRGMVRGALRGADAVRRRGAARQS